jgi:hypothetical protein
VLSELATITTPKYEERVFFSGANGSGKTILASVLAEPYPRVTVLDPKGDFPIPWTEGDYQVRTKPPTTGILNALRWRFGKQHIVYRPAIGYDSGEQISAFFDWNYRRAQREKAKRGRILYVDEGAWVSYAGAWRSLARLLISTRSLRLGVWLSSQRPKGLPVEARSEAWRWYVFYLRSREDRKEVVSYLDHRISEYDLESTTRDYEFWEILRGTGGRMSYRLLPPIRLPATAGQEG